MRIRTGDLVQVVSGADRGRQGKVLAVDRETRRVRVEGVKMQKHHVKAGRKIRKMGPRFVIAKKGQHGSTICLTILNCTSTTIIPARVCCAWSIDGARCWITSELMTSTDIEH